MLEDARTNLAPQASNKAMLGDKNPAKGVDANGMRKGMGSKPSRWQGGHSRLKLHLLVGLFMALTAVAGYAFVGPEANSVDKAGNRLFDFSPNVASAASDPNLSASTSGTELKLAQTTTTPPPGYQVTKADLAHLQAEMNILTQRLNTLTMTAASPRAAPYSGNSILTDAGSASSPEEVLATMEEMTAMLHEMMSQLDAISSETTMPSTQSSSSGHH